MPNKKEKKDAPAPGVAIIGGADGPTAVFISSELMKKQGLAPAENEAGNGMPDGTDSHADGISAEEDAAH